MRQDTRATAHSIATPPSALPYDVFADPVAYLARLGVEAVLISESSQDLPQAA